MNAPNAWRRALKAALVTSSLLAGAVMLPSCGGVKCGPGTRLDAKTNTCLPVPGGDLNVVVDDFAIGTFEFTTVDVPEQMQVGVPEHRSFTLKNAGTKDRPVVAVRFGIAPVQANISELRAALDTASESQPVAVQYLGQAVFENLAAGEARKVDYELNLPVGIAPGMYGLFFSVDEVPLAPAGQGNYTLDVGSSAVKAADSAFLLANAAAVYAPATLIVGVPDKPNLRVLYAKTANASFELDKSARSAQPRFTVNGKLSVQGLDLAEAATVSFRLKLPGHVVDVPGQDLGGAYFGEHGLDYATAPATTTYKYDANRALALRLKDGAGGLVTSTTYLPKCQAERKALMDGGVLETQRCGSVLNDVGVEAIWELYLTDEDARLLGLTRDYATLNPLLSAQGEIAGTLEVVATTPQAEYQGNVSDNVQALPVVFMAPEPTVDATAGDLDNGGVAASPNAWGANGPYPVNISSFDDRNSQGSTNGGIDYRFSFGLNYDRVGSGPPYALYGAADNYLKTWIIGYNTTVLDAQGLLDVGADKTISSWRGKAYYQANGKTALDVQYDASVCTTTAGIKRCPWVGDKNGTALADKTVFIGYSKSVSMKFWGVGLDVGGEAGLHLGIQAQGAFIEDASSPPKRGVEFVVAPWMMADARVWGGLDLYLAAGGISGNITIFRVYVKPTVTADLAVGYDATNKCMTHCEARLGFKVPVYAHSPAGNFDWWVRVGPSWPDWANDTYRGSIFSFSASEYRADWADVTTAWSLKAGQSGMCSNASAPTGFGSALPSEVWRSPTSCGGEYCANSAPGNPALASLLGFRVPLYDTNPSVGNVLAAYKKTFSSATSPTGCLDLYVKGPAEKNFDYVSFWDGTGKLAWPFPLTDWIDATVRICSPSVTVGLTTDRSISYAGVTVTATPVMR